MSELPRGWTRVPLEAVLAEGPTNGYSPSRASNASGTLTLKLSATTAGRFILNQQTTKRLAEDIDPSSNLWLAPGDILVQRANTLGYVGTTALYDGPAQTYVYPDLMMRIRPDDTVMDRAFLSRFMNSANARTYMRERATGTAGNMPKVNGATVRSVPVLVPPLPEQRRIIAKLEDLLTSSRRAEAALDAVPPLLEKLRQSVLAAAFRGDLTAYWREKNPDVEPAEKLLVRIRAERRKKWEEAELAKMTAKCKAPADDRWKQKYVEPEAVDTTHLPELPEGWCWASVEELSWDSGYGTSEKCDYDAEGPPVLRIPNVAAGRIDLTDLKRCKVLLAGESDQLRAGDILVVRTNGSRDLVGRGAVVLEALPQETHFASYLIRFRVAVLDVAAYIAAIWDAPFVRRVLEDHAATSAGQYNVSMSKLATLALPVPPADEMTTILQRLRVAESSMSTLTSTVYAAAELQRKAQASVLARAFRGELVPQDPNDEPAEAMLARVRGRAEPQRRVGQS